MDQLQTPLLDQLILHNMKQPISFHVPGHKYGEIFPGKGREYFTSILKLDATELTGLDDLHSPEGVILEAEKLLSDLYKTKKSFFLINGSTSGNLAMILSALEENDLVLVQRNSHKSIMNGIRLAKAQPVFLSPEYNQESQVASGLGVATVRAAIEANPEAKALILTYPNYYGMIYNLKEIIQLAHEYHIPVLVDEAHGVHFIVGEPFPPSAVSLGADIVVQSAHKTLPAMTMGAYLHYNSEFISLDKVTDYLQILQSSSPSYPIMASLDIARSYLGTFEKKDKQCLLRRIESFRELMGGIEGLTVVENGTGDPLKMMVRHQKGLFSGFKLQQLFEEQGIYAELADPFNVLFVLPLMKEDSEYPLEKVVDKLSVAIAREKGGSYKLDGARHHPDNSHIPFSGLELSYKEMASREEEFVPLTHAVGQVCAETIIPYPPGIPLLLPGERVRLDHTERLAYLIAQGAKIQGGANLNNRMIKIYK
ncbi:Arginine/lysine/ornithine decarboxylase [Mesobacillus persicus]|uniref:Arginine/lysine/ornithine decarboxylase n=1 Tax=Mesobacillus persicus TaxID=930146 RepID=A0A1H8JMV8_9BACI|nr:aminotransferase class I/II-fold pyridoxal phosphate-dependent enzyme [Mesobacillus persicus]SEN82113.1 Arginine/lysine/ornithine decarboxylase [Mesobacillus persicus]